MFRPKQKYMSYDTIPLMMLAGPAGVIQAQETMKHSFTASRMAHGATYNPLKNACVSFT
jgi:hypothetical protein